MIYMVNKRFLKQDKKVYKKSEEFVPFIFVAILSL